MCSGKVCVKVGRVWDFFWVRFMLKVKYMIDKENSCWCYDVGLFKYFLGRYVCYFVVFIIVCYLVCIF